MRKIILYTFYMLSISLLCTSYAFAYRSADFDDDSYASSSNSYYEDRDYKQVHSNHHSARHHARTTTKTTYSKHSSSYSSRLPQTSSYGEKVIIINPRKHVWGAYSADGKLLRAGLATAGASWCPDIHRACRTRSGTFRIYTLGESSCKSKRYPVGRGGAPMPYCMFFNGNQGLHGSHELAEANLSHGCVRISVSDAAWVRFNFATIGTKVVVTSY